MIDLQEQYRLLEARRALRLEPELPVHHYATEYDVPADKLQESLYLDCDPEDLKAIGFSGTGV